MIDVCLINPRTETKTSYDKWGKDCRFQGGVIKASQADIREPPNGLLILATILEKSGYSVEIIDCSILENEQEVIMNKALEARILGFTCLTNTFPKTMKLIEMIYENTQKQPFIMMGGPHASFMYEQILNNTSKIDLIVIGEAEENFAWIVKKILKIPVIEAYYENIKLDYVFNANERKNTISKIFSKLKTPKKGFAYIKKNQIIYTGIPDPIDLKKTIIPSRHFLQQKYTIANILINRGCPNKCSFCSRSKLFPQTRIRPISDVIDEIKDILKYPNYRVINFYDNINMNRKYFQNFLHQLDKLPGMLPWGAELRADLITIDDAKLMKSVRCRGIATGVESANKQVLLRNGKYQNTKKEREGIINLKQADLNVQLFFIIGLPGETEETFQETLNFIDTLPLDPSGDRIEFFLPTPYPGSDIVLRAEHYGVKILSNEYENYNCRELLLETNLLNREKIEKLIEKSQLFLQNRGFA